MQKPSSRSLLAGEQTYPCARMRAQDSFILLLPFLNKNKNK